MERDGDRRYEKCTRLSSSAGETVLLRTRGCRRGRNGRVDRVCPLRVIRSTTAAPPACVAAVLSYLLKNKNPCLSFVNHREGKTTLMRDVHMCCQTKQTFLSLEKFDRMMTNGRERTGGCFLFMVKRGVANDNLLHKTVLPKQQKFVRLIITWQKSAGLLLILMVNWFEGTYKVYNEHPFV